MSSVLVNLPDVHGRFGPYGGRYVPETLMAALAQLVAEYDKAGGDADFQRDFDHYLKTYVGRLSLLYFDERLTKEAGPKLSRALQESRERANQAEQRAGQLAEELARLRTLLLPDAAEIDAP